MIKFALFGAGDDGKKALMELGEDKVEFFIDNYTKSEIKGIPVYDLETAKKYLDENILILITSSKYRDEIRKILIQNEINNYLVYTVVNNRMSNNQIRLGAKQWAEVYNAKKIETVLGNIKSGTYNSWTKEMLNITKIGDKVLEIGCGSGETSLALAKNGRRVCALDYSQEIINQLEMMIKKIDPKIDLRTYCSNAVDELPFENNEFDCVYHAGLLEHFYLDERINMLKSWKRICKKMVSMVPNANCIAYRMWKEKLEKNNEWRYGIEMPQRSMYEDFYKAGYYNIREYTIGCEHMVNNLPKDHYVRLMLENLMQNGYDLNEWGQGYLLVTIGCTNAEEG